LPADVLGRRPGGRQVLLGRGAVAAWPTPARPVLGPGQARPTQQQQSTPGQRFHGAFSVQEGGRPRARAIVAGRTRGVKRGGGQGVCVGQASRLPYDKIPNRLTLKETDSRGPRRGTPSRSVAAASTPPTRGGNPAGRAAPPVRRRADRG